MIVDTEAGTYQVEWEERTEDIEVTVRCKACGTHVEEKERLVTWCEIFVIREGSLLPPRVATGVAILNPCDVDDPNVGRRVSLERALSRMTGLSKRQKQLFWVAFGDDVRRRKKLEKRNREYLGRMLLGTSPHVEHRAAITSSGSQIHKKIATVMLDADGAKDLAELKKKASDICDSLLGEWGRKKKVAHGFPTSRKPHIDEDPE